MYNFSSGFHRILQSVLRISLLLSPVEKDKIINIEHVFSLGLDNEDTCKILGDYMTCGLPPSFQKGTLISKSTLKIFGNFNQTNP